MMEPKKKWYIQEFLNVCAMEKQKQYIIYILTAIFFDWVTMVFHIKNQGDREEVAML